MDVKGKTAIITGASRGIGKQVAIELGRLGANVVVAARTVDPNATLAGTIAETVSSIEETGGQALAVRTDLSDLSDIEGLVRASIERFGGVDVLVNNAAATMTPIAIERAGGLDELVKGSDQTPVGSAIEILGRPGWLRQFDTNLHGPFSLTQAVVPSMRERGGGVIVNMTSMAGDLAPVPPVSPAPRVAPSGGAGRVANIPDRIGYASSKAALNRLANAVAAELRDLGVAIINIDPGYARNETVSLMGELGIVDAEAAIPLEIPVKTIVYAITCDDPMIYTGTVLRAAQFVRDNNL